jgi:hypothetical protein
MWGVIDEIASASASLSLTEQSSKQHLPKLVASAVSDERNLIDAIPTQLNETSAKNYRRHEPQPEPQGGGVQTHRQPQVEQPRDDSTIDVLVALNRQFQLLAQ